MGEQSGQMGMENEESYNAGGGKPVLKITQYLGIEQ